MGPAQSLQRSSGRLGGSGLGRESSVWTAPPTACWGGPVGARWGGGGEDRLRGRTTEAAACTSTLRVERLPSTGTHVSPPLGPRLPLPPPVSCHLPPPSLCCSHNGLLSPPITVPLSGSLPRMPGPRTVAEGLVVIIGTSAGLPASPPRAGARAPERGPRSQTMAWHTAGTPQVGCERRCPSEWVREQVCE